MFEPWQLAMIDAAGYNGIDEEQNRKVAKSLLSTGLTDIDQSVFEKHCYKCGVNPNNYTEKELKELQRLLNE